ncbi:MAG TPA: YigZ family protein [Thermomicrobiales bacterium]|jgi:uncharacterized YigZ family protein|nr:YigZ family protein [Thermomicrobiales bacterium]
MAAHRLIAVDEARAEIEIKRSRFICTLARAADEDAARAVIERIRTEHWQANHNCTAWRIGVGGRQQRTSDDGEPSGTAGVPMLSVLDKRDVTDVVAVVTRYFGGIMLGAGGLIRAYGQAVTAGLDAAGIVERRPLRVIAVHADHGDAGRLENALRASDYAVADIRYAERVTFELALADEALPGFMACLSEATAGRSAPEDIGIRHIEVPVEG